jgi:hypothetical protein
MNDLITGERIERKKNAGKSTVSLIFTISEENNL